MIRLLNLLKIVSVGLFNKYLFKIIIISSCFAIIYGNNKMSEVSNVDYSFLKNKESQFNLGYTSNGSVNYSIDKFISDNLIGSAKVSIIDVDYFQLINQFTIKFVNEKYPFSVFYADDYIREGCGYRILKKEKLPIFSSNRLRQRVHCVMFNNRISS